MFWKNDTEPAETVGHYLGEQLRDRLRLALDFATLGAYELTAPEEEAEPAEATAAPHALPRERPQRVFLFAKVAAPCPHAQVAERPRCAVDEGASRTAKSRPARRRGGVAAPEQPCLASGSRSAPPKPRA
jgi:hypothetical protein